MEGRKEEEERDVKCVIGSLARIMRGRNVSMEVKSGLRNSIFLPTVKYGYGIGHRNQMCVCVCVCVCVCGEMWKILITPPNLYNTQD